MRARALAEIHQEIEARRRRFEAGDTLELLHAIQVCATENLPLPTWLALAFNEHFARLLRPGGPGSLDAIFHSRTLPTKTARQAQRAARDWQIGARLWRAVWAVAPAHNGLGPALDAVLGDGNHPVGKTKATALVRMIDRTHAELTGCQSLSQFWAIRRNE
jgi:hypothetical protein